MAAAAANIADDLEVAKVIARDHASDLTIRLAVIASSNSRLPASL
jgi:hypothetical protein